MANRRRTAPTRTSPLAKAGKLLGGLAASRAASRSRGGGRRSTPQGSGLSRLLRSVKR